MTDNATPEIDLESPVDINATAASKNDIKARNIQAVFGSGLGRIALIAAVVIVVLFLALGIRTLTNKPDPLDAAIASEVTPASVDPRAAQVTMITEEEAVRRAEADAREAQQALAAGGSYQPAMGVEIAPPPDQNVQTVEMGAGEPPTPGAATGPSADELQRLEAERQRQQAQLQNEVRTAEQAREQYIAQIQARSMSQIESIFGNPGINAIGTYTAVRYPTLTQSSAQEQQNNALGDTSVANGGSSASSESTPAPILFKAGSTLYAELDSEINTDDGSSVIATVRGGEWDGSRLIGTIQNTPNNIRATFGIMAPQDGRPTMSINAVAMRTEDAKQGIATKIDHHTVSRYSALGFASLLSGYGKAFEQQPGTTIVNPSGTTVQTIEEPSRRQILGQAAGEMGTAFAAEIKRGFNRPTTFSTPAGTGFALFFLADVTDPSTTR